MVWRSCYHGGSLQAHHTAREHYMILIVLSTHIVSQFDVFKRSSTSWRNTCSEACWIIDAIHNSFMKFCVNITALQYTRNIFLVSSEVSTLYIQHSLLNNYLRIQSCITISAYEGEKGGRLQPEYQVLTGTKSTVPLMASTRTGCDHKTHLRGHHNSDSIKSLPMLFSRATLSRE